MKKTLVLAAGMVLSAGILAFGFTKIVPKTRTVSVRGLSEQDVDADTAVWPVGFATGSNNLMDLEKQILGKVEIVKDFLKSYGLEEKDFSVLAPEITDTTLNVYMNQNGRAYDFVAKQNILVRTNNVEAVKKASASTLELLGKGVSINSDYDNKVSYIFNGLNEIKPEMIAEATESARLAAEKFALDSKSKVGKIQSASQGLFSIENAAPGMEEKKHVRVVTTVVYFLAD